MTNLFPASDFDQWADSYDQSTREDIVFPFAGYEQVLQTVTACADAAPGMSVLDIGTGTGNLAVLFAQQGCDLWCTDFSPLMLEKAHAKLPNAHYVLHDLNSAWPQELERRFDRIVSAYVFHHFTLDMKVTLCRQLVAERLMPGGRLVIADLSFPTFADKEIFKQTITDWEDEFYWFADEALFALVKAGLEVEYIQVSPCAGVYRICMP